MKTRHTAARHTTRHAQSLAGPAPKSGKLKALKVFRHPSVSSRRLELGGGDLYCYTAMGIHRPERIVVLLFEFVSGEL